MKFFDKNLKIYLQQENEEIISLLLQDPNIEEVIEQPGTEEVIEVENKKINKNKNK